jgi:hypothetical protein
MLVVPKNGNHHGVKYSSPRRRFPLLFTDYFSFDRNAASFDVADLGEAFAECSRQRSLHVRRAGAPYCSKPSGVSDEEGIRPGSQDHRARGQ